MSRKFTIVGFTGLVALALWLWLGSGGNDPVPSRPVSSTADHKVPAPFLKELPPVTRSTSWLLPKDVPKGWLPISYPEFRQTEDVARVFELTPEQVAQLEKVLRVFSSDVIQASGKIELFAGRVTRKATDRRAAGKFAEVAIYTPVKREPWAVAQHRLKTGLDGIMGREKAKAFLERAEPVIATATGGFGRYPRIGTVDCYEQDGAPYYRFSWRTGSVAVAEVMGTDFSPDGRTLRELEQEFIKFPAYASSEGFREIPRHLSRILESAESAP